MESKIDRICVFCGSKSGSDPEYSQKTIALAHEFVKRNIGLVYGGGTVGLMGDLSKTVDSEGGSVIGVIPRALCKREISGDGVGEVILVDDMHTRKATMAEKCQAFIALPGGFGTFEELFEVITWSQLGIHSKPIGCLNINGYFDPLKSLIENAIQSGFVEESFRKLVIFESDPVQLIDSILSHTPPTPKIQWNPEI